VVGKGSQNKKSGKAAGWPRFEGIFGSPQEKKVPIQCLYNQELPSVRRKQAEVA